jgi:hypothetical protein
MKKIYQLRLDLRWMKPPIWRRLLVSEETTLQELHYIIQVSMNWENMHLFKFEVGEKIYPGTPYPHEDDQYLFDYYDEDELGSLEEKLKDLGLQENSKFEYTYDFGADWEHLFVVEKILPAQEGQNYPQCIKGKRNAPLEDDIDLEGEEFDTEHFDKEEINQRFADLRAQEYIS